MSEAILTWTYLLIGIGFLTAEKDIEWFMVPICIILWPLFIGNMLGRVLNNMPRSECEPTPKHE